MEDGIAYKDRRCKKERHSDLVIESLPKLDIDNKGVRYPSSIQKFSNPNNNNAHPTQKPVALIEYLIKTYSNEGETILDNCIGSGTTAIACINTNRNYIGFELDKGYYDLAIKRVEEHLQNCK